MITIGLLGGVASGKSTVAKLLADQGAVVLDADRLAGEELISPPVRTALIARWGDQVLDEQGEIIRAEIANRVFGDTDKAADNRQFLEQLIHPRVSKRIQSGLAQLREQQVTAVVLDIPLLLEAGYQQDCDRLLFIDTPEQTRAALAQARGWSQQELCWREAAQRPISEKRAIATDVIQNDSSLAVLRDAVNLFWRTCVSKSLY